MSDPTKENLGFPSKNATARRGAFPRTPAPLLPSLFDRLIDDAPHESSESPSAYAVTDAGLRDLIRRDLGFLLNTLNSDEFIDIDQYPAAACSGLNFGIPPIAGRPFGTDQWAEIQTLIVAAITAFEPRLAKGSVTVEPVRSAAHARRHPAGLLRFEIRGDITCRPYPLTFTVQSAVDLETSRLAAWTD